MIFFFKLRRLLSPPITLTLSRLTMFKDMLVVLRDLRSPNNLLALLVQDHHKHLYGILPLLFQPLLPLPRFNVKFVGRLEIMPLIAGKGMISHLTLKSQLIYLSLFLQVKTMNRPFFFSSHFS